MRHERAEEIFRAYGHGAKVLIQSMYIDTFANLWRDNDNDKIMISSQVWDKVPLMELEFTVNLYYPEHMYKTLTRTEAEGTAQADN